MLNEVTNMKTLKEVTLCINRIYKTSRGKIQFL